MAPRPSRLFHGFRFDVVRLLILDIQCIRTFAVRLFRDACTFFVVIMGGERKKGRKEKVPFIIRRIDIIIFIRLIVIGSRTNGNECSDIEYRFEGGREEIL